MARAWNIFSLGRRRDNEDQLTEMLAWLVDAVPAVGQALVGMGFDGRVPEGEFQFTTQSVIQQGRLDAVLRGPSFALVVESKLGSDFHPTQIERYLDWLETEFAQRPDLQLGLMALTARPIKADQLAKLTSREGVQGKACLWEDLHAALADLAAASEGDQLSGRLVSEFLAMLEEEDLIPVKAFDTAELTHWHEASKTVERFHGFFQACVSEIAESLGAQPVSASKGDNHDYIYQDYRFPDGARMAIGVQASDADRAGVGSRKAPFVWLAVEVADRNDRPEWGAIADKLDESPPARWLPGGNRWWGVRPKVFQYLDEIVRTGTFEEQRSRLAEACAAAVPWLRKAEADVSGSRAAEVPLADALAGPE